MSESTKPPVAVVPEVLNKSSNGVNDVIVANVCSDQITIPPPPLRDVDKEEEPYEELWNKFSKKPPLPGFAKNVMATFLKPEYGQDEVETDAPDGDLVYFIREICKYLVRNGMMEIGIVSNNTDRFNTVNEVFNFTGRDDITVDFLEGYKAVDNDYDVCLVAFFLLDGEGKDAHTNRMRCVRTALISAKKGILIFGNEDLVNNETDNPWRQFVTFLQRMGWINNRLEIFCKVHNTINDQILTEEDLRFHSPLGGCRRFCGIMKCGHHCPYACHAVDLDHRSEYRCEDRCNRVCWRGHRCPKQCWYDCSNDGCFAVVRMKTYCTHRGLYENEVFCSEEDQYKCHVKERKQLKCGHSLIMECHEHPDEGMCKVRIIKKLSCGHYYIRQCHEKPGKSEVCIIPVNKKLDTCNHRVLMRCNSYHEKRPRLKCRAICQQTMDCSHLCQQTCHPGVVEHKSSDCMEPCRRSCPRGVHICKGKDHVCKDHPVNKQCRKKYTARHPCGHSSIIICSQATPDPNNYFCKEKCSRKHSSCNHPCEKLCGEDCGPCEKIVSKYPQACKDERHRIRRKCNESSPKCRASVKVYNEACKHYISVPCAEYRLNSLENVLAKYPCKAPCEKLFSNEGECGHVCAGKCGDCYQQKYHQRCEMNCGKILVCGHPCGIPCNLACRPCPLECTLRCEHTQCEYECGVPCVANCKKPCPYFCKHSKCTRRCSKVCNKETCFRPCSKLLKCGHSCIGYCGEACPTLCRICDSEKLNETLFSGDDVTNRKIKFIFLENCGHCVNDEELKLWINSSLDTSREILPLNCPICRTSMKLIRRFSKSFHENRASINQVKQKIFGDIREIDSLLTGIRGKLDAFKKRGTRELMLKEESLIEVIQEEIELPRFSPSVNMPDSLRLFCSMDIERVKCLDWIADQSLHGCEIVEQFEGNIDERYSMYLKGAWELYLYLICKSDWPLHPNQAIAARKERARLDDYAELCLRILSSIPDVSKNQLRNPIGAKLFRNAEKYLIQDGPYTEESRDKFRARLQILDDSMNFTVNLPEDERRQVVASFGVLSGRWFKCKKGHVYVITECGGAMEVGRCNECGSAIGGENHRMLLDNYLSTEMDNATAPLYTSALDREDDIEMDEF